MEAKTQAWSGTGTALAALAIGVPVHLATDGPFGVALIFYVVAAVALIAGWTPLLRRKFGAGLDSNREESDASTDRLGEHTNWMKDKKGLERLYDEGQSLIEHHWPEPDDREAQKHYREWERRTADYLEAKLGKSHKIQFRGGHALGHSPLIVLLSPAKLRERIDGSLERLGEIIWGLRGPDAPTLSQCRMDGHSYVLVFHNRTGESRIFTAQASLQTRQSVRGIRGGISYRPAWEGTGTNKTEIAHGEVAHLVLAEREVLGSADFQEIRMRFPWTTRAGEATNAVTDLWSRSDRNPFRFKVRVIIAAKPAYDGSPVTECYRLEAFSFGSTPC